MPQLHPIRAGLTMVPNVPWHRAPRREGAPAGPATFFYMPVRAVLPYDTCFIYSYILDILCYTYNVVMLQE